MLEKLILVLLVWKTSSQKLVSVLQVEHPENCPSLVSQVFPYSRGSNLTSLGVTNLSQCVSSCCDSSTCQAALLTPIGGAREGEEGECRHLSCSSEQDCLPVTERGTPANSSLVLVRTPRPPRVCEVGLDSDTCRPGEIPTEGEIEASAEGPNCPKASQAHSNSGQISVFPHGL